MVGFAINQIAQSGLSSHKVFYYSAQLFRLSTLTLPHITWGKQDDILPDASNVLNIALPFLIPGQHIPLTEDRTNDMSVSAQFLPQT